MPTLPRAAASFFVLFSGLGLISVALALPEDITSTYLFKYIFLSFAG